MSKIQKFQGAIPQLLTRIAPFLLPSLLFQSGQLPLTGYFALISPLPIFILTLKNPIWISLLAVLSNLALIASGGNPSEVAIAGFFWFAVGILFPFLIKKSGKVQLSFLLSFIYLAGILFASIAVLAHQAHLGVVDYVHSEVSMGFDRLLAVQDEGLIPLKKMIDEEGRSEVLKQFMIELPPGILITLLLTFWLNLLCASTLVDDFLPKVFWSQYKTPEWLIWPTLVFGALFAFTENVPYYIGLNGFVVLMAIYAFQGLSILGFGLNRYKIYGIKRFFVFCLVILLAWPMLLSLGFFDLWFDFRAKFGQS